MISKSGGARMMEAAYSLMQLAKTSVKLAQLAEEKIPTFHYVQTLLLEERLHLMLC
jgi:acetyl-CoA carboxylase beta subunit